MNEFPGMKTRIDDAVVLPEEFVAEMLGDGAELVVDVGDLATGIGDGDNGVFIQRRFQIADLFERGFLVVARLA